MLKIFLLCFTIFPFLLCSCTSSETQTLSNTTSQIIETEIEASEIKLEYTSKLLHGMNSLPVTISQYPASAIYCKITVSDGTVSDSTLLLDTETNFTYTLPYSSPSSASITLTFYNENNREIISTKILLLSSETVSPDTNETVSYYISTAPSENTLEDVITP